MNKSQRLPLVNEVLEGGLTQPYVHNCLLRVHHGRRTKRKTKEYYIFVRNHVALPVNQSIKKQGRQRRWRGDVLVMKKGVHEDFVNLPANEARLVDSIVQL